MCTASGSETKGDVAMKDDDEINEFAAAALVQMSPGLLRSFTSRAPKRGEPKKLPTKKVGAHLTYSRKDLLRFDEYLRKPWPSEDGKRPHVPTPIQKEVKNESFLQCAVCHSHHDTCEIARIEPVASRKSNRPSTGAAERAARPKASSMHRLGDGSEHTDLRVLGLQAALV